MHIVRDSFLCIFLHIYSSTYSVHPAPWHYATSAAMIRFNDDCVLHVFFLSADPYEFLIAFHQKNETFSCYMFYDMRPMWCRADKRTHPSHIAPIIEKNTKGSGEGDTVPETGADWNRRKDPSNLLRRTATPAATQKVSKNKQIFHLNGCEDRTENVGEGWDSLWTVCYV